MALCVTLAVLNSGAFPCMKSTTEFVKNSTPPFYASISPLLRLHFAADNRCVGYQVWVRRPSLVPVMKGSVLLEKLCRLGKIDPRSPGFTPNHCASVAPY